MPLSPAIRRVLSAPAAAFVIVGLLGIVPYEESPDRPDLRIQLVFPEAPEPPWWNEYEGWDDEALDGTDPYPYHWAGEFPRHPVTGRVMDPLFDCGGMPGPPGAQPRRTR